jgi:hypothetical protein
VRSYQNEKQHRKLLSKGQEVSFIKGISAMNDVYPSHGTLTRDLAAPLINCLVLNEPVKHIIPGLGHKCLHSSESGDAHGIPDV